MWYHRYLPNLIFFYRDKPNESIAAGYIEKIKSKKYTVRFYKPKEIRYCCVTTLRKAKQIIEEEMEEDAGVKLRMLDVEI